MKELPDGYQEIALQNEACNFEHENAAEMVVSEPDHICPAGSLRYQIGFPIIGNVVVPFIHICFDRFGCNIELLAPDNCRIY